jgi:arylsulfatase A
MKRRQFIRTAGAAAAGTALVRNLMLGRGLFSNNMFRERKPNIIFILADDLGIGDVSCYGADNYRTPNIDKLAREGIRFTHAYTAPLCGPSRACILTGRYAFRTGATNQDSTGQFEPAVEIMTPKVLKQAGYVTSMIGKWGQLPYGPSEFEFDDYIKFRGSGVFWNTKPGGVEYVVNGVTKILQDKEYMPDLMHDHLVNFLNMHQKDPFYVYYSLSHIHGEIMQTPDSTNGENNWYADNISYMDKLVGKLITELERLKLRENTLILFFGDNGTAGGHAPTSTIGGRRLSGQKGSMLEGGALVPLIANWPGTTPKGKIIDDMIDSTDFMPTFAELTGTKLPSTKVFDGTSFNAQLHGEKGNKREWIYIQLAKMWYTREAAWKLNQAGELFDMRNAPFEEKLVPADTTDTTAIAARKRLQAALDKLNPAGGILDQGDGTGRHASKKAKKEAKKQDSKQVEKKLRTKKKVTPE